MYVRLVLVMSYPELVCLGFGTGVKCQLSLEAFASVYSEPERTRVCFLHVTLVFNGGVNEQKAKARRLLFVVPYVEIYPTKR